MQRGLSVTWKASVMLCSKRPSRQAMRQSSQEQVPLEVDRWILLIGALKKIYIYIYIYSLEVLNDAKCKDLFSFMEFLSRKYDCIVFFAADLLC